MVVAKYDALLHDHMKYSVLDHQFCNEIPCSTGSIFPYSDRSALLCQFSRHILSYNQAFINCLILEITIALICWTKHDKFQLISFYRES